MELISEGHEGPEDGACIETGPAPGAEDDSGFSTLDSSEGATASATEQPMDVEVNEGARGEASGGRSGGSDGGAVGDCAAAGVRDGGRRGLDGAQGGGGDGPPGGGGGPDAGGAGVNCPRCIQSNVIPATQCSHMTCSHCGLRFCFLCLQEWGADCRSTHLFHPPTTLLSSIELSIRSAENPFQ